MGKIVNCVRGKPTFQIYIYNQSILLIEVDTKILVSQDIFQKKIYSKRKRPSGEKVTFPLQSNKVINFITLPPNLSKNKQSILCKTL